MDFKILFDYVCSRVSIQIRMHGKEYFFLHPNFSFYYFSVAAHFYEMESKPGQIGVFIMLAKKIENEIKT